MEMMVNATRGDERYGGHHNLGLRLGLSLGIATAAEVPVDEPSSLPQQQHALSVAPISPRLSAPTQCWNGFISAGSFFSQSPGMDVSPENKHPQRQAPTCQGHEMPFLRGIDVNRAPAGGESRRGGSCSEDDEPGASSSSPNSTLCCSLRGNGKRGAPARLRRAGSDLKLTPRGAGGESDDEDSGAGAGGSRKKLRLSKDQAAVLEESFKEHNTLDPKQKAALAKQLNLMPRQVEVWFQNRRARTKLKQTEVDCEFLKRCCESLTEQNRRLQREVAELRALKLAAPRYGRMPPLTLCPSCVRIAVADEASRAAPTGPRGPVPVRPVFVDASARRP